MNEKNIANKKDIIIHLQSRLTGGPSIAEDNKYFNILSVS